MIFSVEHLSYERLREPVFLFRPKILSKKINFFLNNFNGKALYSVKTNPSRFVLESIYDLGLQSFDVASINEIKILKNLLPNAEVFFMNPIKPRRSISEAYFDYGVRNFSLDDNGELKKILEETNNATDLKLHMRLSVPNHSSSINLSKKFGIDYMAAPNLLRKVKEKSSEVGISFHTGSQCMSPDAYMIAIKIAGEVIKNSQVDVDFFNVGGGFPTTYTKLKPVPIINYFNVIHREFDDLGLDVKVKLLAEPGRCLVAESMSLIVRVDLRKGRTLYINDGTHSYLRDAGGQGFSHPVRLINNEKINSDLIPFAFYGPTCDSNDFMQGPFYLPSSIKEGDLIEIGQMGSYSMTMKNNFNGFYSDSKVFVVDDNPFLSLRDLDQKIEKSKIESF